MATEIRFDLPVTGKTFFRRKKVFSAPLFPKFAEREALQQPINTNFTSLLTKNGQGLSGKDFSALISVGDGMKDKGRVC